MFIAKDPPHMVNFSKQSVRKAAAVQKHDYGESNLPGTRGTEGRTWRTDAETRRGGGGEVVWVKDDSQLPFGVVAVGLLTRSLAESHRRRGRRGRTAHMGGRIKGEKRCWSGGGQARCSVGEQSHCPNIGT